MPADPHSLSDKSLGIRRKPRGHNTSFAKVWWYGQWQGARRQNTFQPDWVDYMLYQRGPMQKREQWLRMCLRQELRRRLKLRAWCKHTGRGCGPQPRPLP